jgi:hypothetical protein
VSPDTNKHSAADSRGRTAAAPRPQGVRRARTTTAVAARPPSAPATEHYDLAVQHACEQWTKIRWSLFVFPDIADVAPTDDPDVVRIFYEGRRAYPDVWRVELLQAGFDVPAADTAEPSPGSGAPARRLRSSGSSHGSARTFGVSAMQTSGASPNGHPGN